MSDITVKIGKGVGGMKMVNFAEGTRVADAIAKTGMSASGQEIRVNGATVSGDTVLRTGDTVMLISKIRGA